MSAVAALPKRHAALFKYLFRLYIVQKFAVSLLVGFLNGGNAPELLCKFMETFLIRLPGHAVVHVRPLIVFSFCCVEKVLRGIAQSPKRLKPQFCMLFFIFRSLQEQSRNLLITGFLRYRSKIRIFIPRLRFSGESLPQIFLCFCSREGIFSSFHFVFLHFLIIFIKLDSSQQVFHRFFRYTGIIPYALQEFSGISALWKHKSRLPAKVFRHQPA